MLHVHLAFVVREVLDINNIGKSAPPVFFMSDGGHIENLGLLPLLNRRCKKIVVADAGLYPNSHEVCSAILSMCEDIFMQMCEAILLFVLMHRWRHFSVEIDGDWSMTKANEQTKKSDHCSYTINGKMVPIANLMVCANFSVQRSFPWFFFWLCSLVLKKEEDP